MNGAMIVNALLGATVVLGLLILLVTCHKEFKRPLVTVLMVGVLALACAGLEVIQNPWMNILIMFLLLILILTVFLLFEKGILGLTDEFRSRNIGKSQEWQKRNPRLSKFLEGHPRLSPAILYGSLDAFFVRGASLRIMDEYKTAWASLQIDNLLKDGQMARQMILSEGLNSPLKSLLVVVFIWSAVTITVVFISSLFVQDRTALWIGTIPLLTLSVFTAIFIHLTLLQRLILISVCVLCAFVSTKLCFWDISERVCRLFSPKEPGSVKSEGLVPGGNSRE